MTTAIEIADLSVSFGTKVALNNVTFNGPAAATIGLLGRNGAGKSTLLRVLAGREPRYRGTVTSSGEPIDRSGIVLAGDGWRFAGDQTVANVMKQYLTTRPNFDRDQAEDWLELFTVPTRQRISRLSQGQSSAASAVLALAARAPITLLD